jgi:hypothetical protein
MGIVHRTKQISFCLTPDEFNWFHAQFSRTTCRKMSEYFRKILLNKSVTVLHRNQSLDECMEELIGLRQDLQGIVQNFNQVVQKLHSLQTGSQLEGWILLQESRQKQVLEKVETIQQKIDKISDLWLQ